MDLTISTDQRSAIIITFLLYTATMLIVGFFAKRMMDRVSVEQYLSEFYTGGRGMGMLAIAFMLAAGLCGAGTFVGGPGMDFKIGGVWLIMAASQIYASFIVLGQIGKKVGIVARRINATSYLDLIAHRFSHNKAVLIMGVVSITVFMTACTVAQCIAGARVFEAMTGLSYKWGLAFFALSVIIITTLGGIRGVALATIIQGIAMTIAVVCLLAGTHFAVSDAGGWSALTQTITAREPEYFDLNRWSIPYEWSQWVIYGFAIISMPHLTMGALTYKNTQAMKNAITLGVAIVTLWTLGLCVFAAIAAKGLYPSLRVPDHAIAVLTMNVVPSWLAGITLAGVASAVQSTVAAMIMVVSSTLVVNCIKQFSRKKLSPQKEKAYSKIITLLVATSVFLLSIRPPELLQNIITFGMGGMAGAFFFTFLLGLYWKRANEEGAAAGMATGFLVYLVAQTHILPVDIALGMHPVVISLATSLIVNVCVTLMTPKPPLGIVQTWFARNYPQPNL